MGIEIKGEYVKKSDINRFLIKAASTWLSNKSKEELIELYKVILKDLNDSSGLSKENRKRMNKQFSEIRQEFERRNLTKPKIKIKFPDISGFGE